MIVGYARTSTIEQEAGFEAQLKQLKAAGCEKVFSEQVSAVATTREQLEAALDFIREGDVFVCCKLDRLARSVPHLCEIGAKLEAKGVSSRCWIRRSTRRRRPAGSCSTCSAALLNSSGS